MHPVHNMHGARRTEASGAEHCRAKLCVENCILKALTAKLVVLSIPFKCF